MFPTAIETVVLSRWEIENFNLKSTELINDKYLTLNFYGSLFLLMGEFLCFAGTNFYNWEKLVFLTGN